ncbi:hypothetical protein M877_00105 [Streptomyces niveus NCIMB 11891]|nr:hypothetical protein M877_00105 [Streptomyces niveus NCIMB 11891]
MIGAVLPLADVAHAHSLLEGGSVDQGRGRPRGKIALAVHPWTSPRTGRRPGPERRDRAWPG